MNMPKYFCLCAPLNSQLLSSRYRYVLFFGGWGDVASSLSGWQMVGDIIATRVSGLGGKNVIVLYCWLTGSLTRQYLYTHNLSLRGNEKDEFWERCKMQDFLLKDITNHRMLSFGHLKRWKSFDFISKSRRISHMGPLLRTLETCQKEKLIGTSISWVLVISTSLPFLSTLLHYNETESAKFIEFLAGWWHHCHQSAQIWWPKYHCAVLALIISMRGRKIKIHMGDGCSPSPNTCCLCVEMGLENIKPWYHFCFVLPGWNLDHLSQNILNVDVMVLLGCYSSEGVILSSIKV
jgi:hypothetical protein